MFIKHKIQTQQIAPGVRLLNIKTADFPVSVVSAWFRAGSRFDQKEGLAHLFEHLLMKRTKEFADPIKRLEFLESQGIYFNAHTDYELAHYYQIQGASQVLESLQTLLNCMDNPIFQQQDLEDEKRVVLAEGQDKHDDAWEYAWQLSNQATWPGTNFAKSFFGNKQSIKSINIKDLQNFFHNFYQNNEIFLVTLGNQDIKEIAKVVHKILPNNKRAYKKLLDKPKVKPKNFIIEKRANKQLVVSLSYRVPTSQFIFTDFVRQYFSNLWLSKFNQSLRLNNKLTYWVYGDYAYFSDVSHLRFAFSCDKKDLPQCLELIKEDIEKAKNFKNIEEDLAIFKQAFLGSLQRQMVDPYELVWWYGRQFSLKSEIVDLKKLAEQINKIQAKDLQNFVSKYFVSNNQTISVIGDILQLPKH